MAPLPSTKSMYNLTGSDETVGTLRCTFDDQIQRTVEGTMIEEKISLHITLL